MLRGRGVGSGGVVVVMDEDDVVVAVVTIGLHSPLPFLCVAR